MGTVTGYTAEKMEEISQDNIVDGDIVGDNLHLITRGGDTIDAGNVRGATGEDGPPGDVEEAPTDGGLYVRKDSDWTPITPNKGFGVRSAATTFNISSTTGQDFHPAVPLDVTFTKIGDATQSNILVAVIWSGHLSSDAWCTVYGGIKISAVDHWGQVGHQCNLQSHFEFSDKLWLTGLSAGSKTLRARVKTIAGSNIMECDVGDFFRLEYEEVYF